MSKCVILDGVGINFKTSILKHFQGYGWEVLKSNSYLYTNEIATLFPGSTLYSSKILHRYIELCQITELDRPTIIDRGIINQLIWSEMARDQYIYCYPYDQQDLDLVHNNIDHILDLNRQFDPIKILIKTNDRRLVESCFEEEDDHAIQRKEVFDSVDGYFETQEEYIRRYKKLVPDFIQLEIDDSRCSIHKKIQDLIYQIELIYEKANNTYSD